MESEIHTGKIRALCTGRGFGFIETATENNVFCHISNCNIPEDGLNIGDVVTFEIKRTFKGPAAFNVTRVSEVGE